MPRSLTHFSLALMLLLSSEAWALGLGDIRLESALNEPLRAEIELLSVTPEELSNLQVGLASAETFARYGLDRPFYLQDMRFEVVRTGRPGGNFIRVSSTTPMTEPFLTFLVEATWSRGRLLREYTVLLDPPTFAPPTASQPAPQVQAPTRTEPVDSGRIEREPAPQQVQTREPARPAPSRPAPKPEPVPDDTPFDATAGGDYQVARGETLWGIATAMRPDSRLTMSQTMLAIYEANPGAFGGNINLLREGARLTIPSADDIYRIDRGSAVAEVERQNSAWDGTPAATTATSAADSGSRPSLTLVPPDEEPVGVGIGSDDAEGTEPMSREQAILDRIAEIEAADVPTQRSLIEVRSNELANLRQELAEIRGEVYEPEDTGEADPFVDETPDDAADDLFPDFDEIMADDSAADEDVGTDDAAAAEDEALAEDAAPADPTPTTVRRVPQPSLIDQVIGWLTNTWVLIIGGALLAAVGLLVWFFRRGGGDEPDAWGSRLDADDIGGADMSGTESMRAPARDDESFVVVEQDTAARAKADTMEVAAPPAIADDETGSFDSLQDTFSSETAVNLDQSDPIAEADFHMAYGLYDQAADLINGALAVEPEREDLLTKLCEIYFVWGNRDAFVDAAERLQQVSGGASAEWDKIVIMGQQIASDHSLFAGAGVAGATKEVDLSFESDGDDTGALDIDFGSEDGGEGDDGIDFVFEADAAAGGEGDEEGLDFSVTSEMPTVEQPADEATIEMPADEPTAETPTIEEQFTAPGDGTAEMPSLEDALEASYRSSDATAEIDLDDLDLDLDLDGLAETELASLDHELGDDEATELASLDDLDETGTNESLRDDVSITGKNPQVDPNATGVQESIDPAASGISEELDFDDLESTSEMRLARDETGQNPMMDTVESSDGDEEDLLAATGRTQVLSGDMAVDTDAGDDDETIGDDDRTMLASSMDDDDEDFDFAKTEALPPGTYGDPDPDATGELPAVGSTDVDLDLDDLTAALSRSEIDGGDTVEQPRDDRTVEQPRPPLSSDDDDTVETQAIAPDDMSDDLQDARTMTEVGTKLDLARAYVDMGDPSGARSILEEVLDEGDQSQRQQAQQLLDSLPN